MFNFYKLTNIVVSSVILLGLFSHTAWAGQNAMATNLGLSGSHTWDMAVDPNDNNYIYIATYYSPNGFFRSSDGGATWHGLPNNVDHGAGHSVEINPANGHVYALLQDLLVSTDHGETYTVAQQFEAGAGTMLYAHNALYVTSNDAVMKSTDEGTTFSTATVCASETIWSLINTADALYALCYNYDTEISTLYKSADLGTTWVDVDIATSGITGAEKVVANPVTDAVYLLPNSTGGTTYRSTDAASTWTALTNAPVTGNMSFNSAGRIYVGWNYSDDNGDTWTQFSDRGDYNHIIMPDPTDDTILYDTTTPGFWKSTDSGATWTASVEGITGVEVTAVAQAADKNIVWVATQNGLAKTENFQAAEPTWEYPILQTGNLNFTSSGYDSVWVNPTDSNYVVASSSQDLHYSINGGTTWTASDVENFQLTGAVFQIVSNSTGTVYATVGPNVSTGSQTGGVIKSTDSGATWTSLAFPDDGAARSITVASDGDLFVGTHASVGGIYKYDGSAWTKLSAPDEYEYRAIIANSENPNTIYALANQWPADDGMGFYRSTDDGATWTQMVNGLDVNTEGLYEFNTMALQTATSPNTLYVSAVQNSTLKGIIYKSSDNGETWSTYYIGKSGETFKTLLFDGLVAGNTVGIFSMKSRVNLKLTVNNQQIATITLKDAATKKLLKNRRVKLYQKVIGKTKWKYVATVITNQLGQASVQLSPSQDIKLRAIWNPRKKDKAEYTSATAKKVTLNVAS